MAIHRGKLRAPTATTLEEAGEELIEGMRSGRVRNKSGDLYKPSAIRSYERALTRSPVDGVRARSAAITSAPPR